MTSQNNPYRGFTIAEVAAAEATSYVIQVGEDFFCYKGQFSFSQKTAATLYNKILANLVDLINNGNEKQQKKALKCIISLKLMPLRIQ